MPSSGIQLIIVLAPNNVLQIAAEVTDSKTLQNTCTCIFIALKQRTVVLLSC